jgi:hypothetical protein
MLVWDQHTIPPPHAVNFPDQTPAFRFEGECQPLALILLALDFNVQTPTSIHPLIRYAQVLHLFEVKKPLTVR